MRNENVNISWCDICSNNIGEFKHGIKKTESAMNEIIARSKHEAKLFRSRIAIDKEKYLTKKVLWKVLINSS